VIFGSFDELAAVLTLLASTLETPTATMIAAASRSAIEIARKYWVSCLRIELIILIAPTSCTERRIPPIDRPRKSL
jgi:hypothetical protein